MRDDDDWRKRTSTKAFVFPVHVSGLFLEPGTLSSSLYLLVLKLMNRDYTGAVALIGSIGTVSAVLSGKQRRRPRASLAILLLVASLPILPTSSGSVRFRRTRR